MSIALLFFIAVAAVSLAAGCGVVASRRPVHSALFLLVNFVTLAVFFITLGAQFLAAAQVIIYAGGIVILILFVVMLVGSERIGEAVGQRFWTPYAGLALGLILLVAMFYTFTAAPAPRGFPAGGAILTGDPEAVGMTLFTRYILPFEMVAVLLLVALIGALLLAKPPSAGETKAESS